jgi:serine O-acetyltransferase
VPFLPGILYRLNYLVNGCILVPTSDIAPTACIGRGVLLSFADVGSDAILHEGVIVARNVRHLRAVQTGNLEIGNGAEVETGAIIVGADGMRIGDGARVNAGAVVTKSVPPGCTVAGVPAHIVAPSGQAE